jgi:hypothetical protein
MIASRRLFAAALVLCLLPVASACRKAKDTEPPVATAGLRLNHPRAALGSPVEITYKFTVAANAPAFGQDYRVMVHFLDADEEMMWTDDHQPSVPTSQWKPGQTVEYTRTLFIPVYPYIGEAAIQMGLYSARDGKRLPLAGEDSGQRAYKVATVQLLPQTENILLLFKEGWHPAETAADNPQAQWQWTKKDATIAFRNPRRDVTLYLHGDNPGTAFTEAQTVQVTVNGQPVESITIQPKQEVLHRAALTAAQLGTAEMVEVRLTVDKTFVPALLPAANSRDPRELGVRIFHAFVEPR